MPRANLLVLNNFTHDSRVLKTGLTLRSLGYDITVIALHDNRATLTETVHGLNVERIHLKSRAWPKLRMIQVLKFLEWTVAAVWRSRRVDVVHCNDLNTLPTGVLLKLLTLGRTKIVYDAHEFESNQRPNQSRLTIRTLQAFEGALIRFADAVITVSQSIADEYARIYGIRPPDLVLNCPPFRPLQKRDLFRRALGIHRDQKIFLYQGALTAGRGVELLLNTFTGTRAAHVVVFMGYGNLETVIQEHAARNPNVFFHPAVSPDAVLDYTSSADVGILVAERACLSYEFSLPNKLFEYVMAGIPVVTSTLREMRRFVETTGVGVVAKQNSVEAVRDAMRTVLALDASELRTRIDIARGSYCWEQQEVQLQAVYRSLAKASREETRV